MANQYQQYQQQPNYYNSQPPAQPYEPYAQPPHGQPAQPYGQPARSQPAPAPAFGGGGGGGSGNEHVQRQFPIPSNKSGNIIGKGGSIIRQTRQTTGCHIKIMDTRPGERDRMVVLNGTDLQVRNAYYTILGQLEGHGQPVGGGYGAPGPTGYAGGGGGGAAGDTHQVIAVDNTMVGALIGKGGTVIRNIRQTSGATVKISSAGESSDPSKRIVTIWGANDAVLCAQQMIFTQLQQAAQDASGGRGGGGRGGGGRGGGGDQQQHQQQQQQQQQTQMTSSGEVVLNLSVANEVAGSLIGRGGSNIKELRRLSEAQIRIGDRMPGQAMRTITVIGTAQQLQVAQELISGQINSGGGGYITGNAAAAAAAAGAYVPDVAAAAADTGATEVTVAPAPAYQPEPEAYQPAPAPAPATQTPLIPGPIPSIEPAPAPAVGVGVAIYASPTKRKAEDSEEASAKKTKTEADEDAEPEKSADDAAPQQPDEDAAPQNTREQDVQELTTKWMQSTVVKIKAEMKRQGLDTAGRKIELVDRLVEHLLQ